MNSKRIVTFYISGLEKIMATNNEKLERGKRVRLVRKMVDLTIDEFANAISVSNRTVKYWETGEHGGLSEKGAEKILAACDILQIKCSIIWLLYGAGYQPILVGNPYNKIIPSPNNTNNNSDNHIKKEVHYFLTNNLNAITMQITDDAMEPHFLVGDIVGGKRKKNKDIKYALHQDCIVETKKQLFCRRLLPGTKPKLFTLCCINQKTNAPFVLTDIKIKSAAPIIWLRRKEK